MPSLGTIANIKNSQNAYQPLLLAAVVFRDSEVTPTTLLLSTHGLNTADGGAQPTGITNFPYNNQNFLARIKNQEIAATQALSENGIDITPTVGIELVDADKTIWNTYEKAKGFKGAKLTLYYVFWEVGTANFSSDFKTIFVGVCSGAKVSERSLSFQAVSRMNMNQSFLPITRIQKRCPRIFPDTTGLSTPEATAVHQIAADDPSAQTWLCGYSYLATGSNARGNAKPGGGHYTSCNQILSDCIDRLGNRTLTYNPLNPVERDSSNRVTARFAGVQWDSPAQFKSRGYGQQQAIQGFNANNEGKYNDYVPMGWGTYWIDPVVLTIVGDANFTRMEVLLGEGQFNNVRKVIVNDIDVDKFSSDPAVQRQQIALQLSWTDVTTGDRSGACNRDTIYDSRGDSYGGMKVISITVPRQLTPSSSIPRIRALVDGPKVRVYSDLTTYTLAFSTNPAWCMLDVMIKLGWRYSDIDIQTFIDAAAYYDAQINYNNISGFVDVAGDGVTVTFKSGADFGTLYAGNSVFINGVAKTVAGVQSYTQFTITAAFGGALSNVTFIANGPNTHSRFKTGFGLSQRISGSDLVRQIRTSCRTTMIPSSSTGLLQIFPEKTLADEQPSAVTGSNYNTAIRSKTSAGVTANGYVAWKFDYSSIIRESNKDSSLVIDQLDIKDSINTISFAFSDEDNQYQQDSLTLIDSNDVQRVDQQVNGQIPVIGIPNFDQSKRVGATWLARKLRGNARQDTGGSYLITIRTSFKCVHLRMGHIVLVGYAQLAIDAGITDGAGAPLSGFLARVIAVKPDSNYKTVQVTLDYHNDDWYVDTFQQQGFQRQRPQFRNSLTRPSFPWSPWQQQPINNDALYSRTDWQMGIAQEYAQSASNQPLAKISVTGKIPINTFAKDGMPPPSIGVQGTTANTGGNIVGGRRYYVQVCARNSDESITPPSDPSAPCVIDVPSGTNTNTITAPIVNFPEGATKADVFAGYIRNQLSFQKQISVTPPTNPASVTVDVYNDNTWGVPDVEFNSLGVRGKRGQHVGLIGASIVAVTSTTIKLSLFSDNQFTTNQFAPDSGFYYYIMLAGLVNNSNPVPIANWKIASNTGDTFTLEAGGIDPTTIDRGDGTTGLQPFDVVLITMRPTVGSDAGGNYVQDVNWVNALNQLGESHSITDATNASPIVVTTADDHGLLDGQKVYIQAVNGNTATNGVRWVDRLSATTFALYSNSSLTTAVAGNGAYTNGGQVQRQFEGLVPNEEAGRELYCAFGTGAGLWYRIKSNTKDKIYIDGEWQVTPDKSSVFFVLNPNWEFEAQTSNINNSNENAPVNFSLDIPNFAGQVVFVQSFTQDGGGNEAFRSLCPWRVAYVFGQESGGVSGLAAIHLTVDGNLAIASDLAPRYRPNSDVKATAVRVEVKTAPVGADLTVEIYLDTTLWMTLVLPAGDTVVNATAGQINSAVIIEAGKNIRVDLTTVGTTTPGEDLAVSIYSN